MGNKLKHYIIHAFEQENYKLSSAVKQKMIQQLSYTELIKKLSDMAEMPAITQFGEGNTR